MRRSTIHPPSLLLAEGFRKSTRAQTMGGPALDEEHLRASVDSTDVYCICLYHYIYIWSRPRPEPTFAAKNTIYIYYYILPSKSSKRRKQAKVLASFSDL